MPGTAKRIAKRAKIRYKGEGDLLDPTINASLGIDAGAIAQV